MRGSRRTWLQKARQDRGLGRQQGSMDSRRGWCAALLALLVANSSQHDDLPTRFVQAPRELCALAPVLPPIYRSACEGLTQHVLIPREMCTLAPVLPASYRSVCAALARNDDLTPRELCASMHVLPPLYRSLCAALARQDVVGTSFDAEPDNNEADLVTARPSVKRQDMEHVFFRFGRRQQK